MKEELLLTHKEIVSSYGLFSFLMSSLKNLQKKLSSILILSLYDIANHIDMIA